MRLNMPVRFHSSLTMFVYLKGHAVLEYYLEVADAFECANDSMGPSVRTPE